MTDEEIKHLKRYVEDSKNINKLRPNMIKKYMFLLIREGKQSFQEALKIQYRRRDQQTSMEELNKLVRYIQNELKIIDEKKLAYALGISARILASSPGPNMNQKYPMNNPMNKR